MNLLWPGFLLLLGLIPLILAAYIWMLRCRRRFAVRYSSLALVREALPHQSRLRRQLPFALFLAALVSLVIAVGRPVASVHVPAGHTTIILAMDISRSMCATDIRPNRLEAAQAAALSFIQRQNSSIQFGIVAFAGFAALAQPPTTDQEALHKAVESLTTARWTAIGSGILTSLDAIAEVNPDVMLSVDDTASGARPTPVPKGAYAPDIIVLLSDGASNTGPWPLEAAQQAVERGIRVHTIGFGTADESVSMPFCGQSFGGYSSFNSAVEADVVRFRSDDPFGGGQSSGGHQQFGGGSSRFRRGIDEGTLKQIAAMTGGAYYLAESASELEHVFQTLPITLRTRKETREISVTFAAIGALLSELAILLALIWHPLL